MDKTVEKMSRRSFLISAAGMASGAVRSPVPAQDTLYVLKPGNVERLRADFNVNRNRVRLLTILSPT